MQAADASLDEIRMHYAAQESALVYGGAAKQRTPLELLMDSEEFASEEERRSRTAEAAEILFKLISFAAEPVLSAGGLTLRRRRIARRIKEGQTVEYIKESRDAVLPSVTIRDAGGNILNLWEPARLKSIYKGREAKGEKGGSAEIVIWEVIQETAAVRVGTRMIALAQQGGINALRELSGAGIAKKLNVTRQAVSLTNKAMDNQIRQATGGKSGARGLRHRPDPRKGMKIAALTP